MLSISRYGEVIRFDLSRTLAGRGRYWTTAYLVGDVLIDTGCAFSAGELLEALGDRPIRGVINTHSHEDHIGANGRLQRRQPELAIAAQPLALPVLADPRGQQPLHPYRRIMWGWPEPSTGRPLADGDLVEAGSFNFQVLYTPGHSPDHLCLFEPEQGWLFSGDLFIGGKDRALRQSYEIWPIIASLRKAAALPAKMLFPGCARVRDNAQAALATKADYLEALGQKIQDLHQAGLSEGQIVGRLLGGPMWIEFITLGHFTRKRLVRSYLEGNRET